MTADHAGQTGGERDPHWIKDHFELGESCCTVDGYPPCRDCPRLTPSRPVPVAGQAAREAAVEAVPLRQAVENFLLGVWPLVEQRRFDVLAARITSLIELDRDLLRAALSAAGGQQT